MRTSHAGIFAAFAASILTTTAVSPVRGCIANPNPIDETQPDGTKIVLRFKGDKYFHWYEDPAGYTVLRGDDGYYVHAALDESGNLAPTKSRVGLDEPRANALVPGIMPTEAALREARGKVLPTPPEAAAKSAQLQVPPTGTVKNLVILARFSDHGGRTLPTVGNFNTLFNTVGGDPTYAPTGSVRDVYSEMSYGQMTLQSTVVGWVTLPNTEAYYANNDRGLTTRTHDLIRDALAAADPLVDFNQFDTDGNGYVDSIAFVHSGYAAEFGGTDAFGAPHTARIWSHRWSLFTGEFTSAEGEKVNDYHINPGVWGTSGSAIGRVGVIAHETGHFFGLPDLYDTDAAGAGEGHGIGSWCMMANSWGFSGDQLRPPHFSPWCKIELGWLTPIAITTGGNYNIGQVQTNATVHKITSGFPTDEYLLIENRNKTGYDSNLPVNGGLAIWHIDDQAGFNTQGYPGQAGWPGNGNHYRVALLQADGNYDLEKNINQGDAGDLYRSGGVTSIGPSTVPSTDRYQGGNVADTNITISSISAGGTTMSYTLALGGAPVGPEIAVADGGTNVPDGGGPVSFGTASQGSAAPTKTFRVSNQGSATLTTSAPTVPAGYLVTEALSASIGAGAFDDFTVSLSTANQGTFTGSVSFANNDADENPFNFSVTGTINAGGGGNNDLCANATPIVDGQTVTGTTVGATVDGSTTCGSSGSSPDVWYRYESNCNGTAIANTCGSNYDTVLSVHSACGTGTTIVCDDDDDSGACGTDSVVSFNVAAGTAYLFRVSGFSGATGSYSLNLDVACSNPQVAIDQSEVVFDCSPGKSTHSPAVDRFRNLLPKRTSKFANEEELAASFAKSVDGTVDVVVTLEQPWDAIAKTDRADAASMAALHAATAAVADAAIAQIPAQEMMVIRRYENFAGFAATTTREGLEALAKSDLVYAIEPSFEILPHLAQGIPQMNATATRSAYTGAGMSIAICDTGIDYDHPRLGGGGFPNSKVLGGFDFGDNDANPDSNGEPHGTACAGIAAGGLGTVGDYIGGVAHEAKLYALKMSPGTTGSASSESMIASWDWCATHWNDNPAYPMKVISTSFGGGRFTSACDGASPAMTMAAASAMAAGITLLVSSGNDGYCDSMGWPACIGGVISVGAVYDGATGSHGWCVNAGSCHPGRQATGGCSTGWVVQEDGALNKVTAYSNSAPFLDIFAPANNASTADVVGSPGYTTGDFTTTFGGTSAACPYAAGAAALLQHAAKATTGEWLAPETVHALLMATGDPITDTKVALTRPRVNLGNAVAQLPQHHVYGHFVARNTGEGTLTVTAMNASKGGTPFEVLTPMPLVLGTDGTEIVVVKVDCGQAQPGDTLTLTTVSNSVGGEASVTIRLESVPVGDALSIH